MSCAKGVNFGPGHASAEDSSSSGSSTSDEEKDDGEDDSATEKDKDSSSSSSSSSSSISSSSSSSGSSSDEEIEGEESASEDTEKTRQDEITPAPFILQNMEIKTFVMEDAGFEFSGIPGVSEPIVHWKGFGERVSGLGDPESPSGAQLVRAVDFVCSQYSNGTIVWDGDKYSEESFTFAIPIMAERCPGMKFVAFKGKGREMTEGGESLDIAKFKDSWKNYANRILGVVSVDVGQIVKADGSAGTDYPQLGEKALAATGSKIVVCLGGGPVVGDEFARNMKVKKNWAHWHVFSVSRTTNGAEEIGSLEKMFRSISMHAEI